MTPAPSSLYYVWDPPGATLTVLMNLDLVDGLRAWIDNARGERQDVQGFLVGHRETDSAGRTVITVEDCEPVAAGEIGPLPEPAANVQYGPVGFLNSGPDLSAEQINGIRRLFHEPDPVLLSVGPEPELCGRWAILDPSVEVEPEGASFPFDRAALARDSAHLLRSPRARVSRFEAGLDRWGRRGLLGMALVLLAGGGWQAYRLLVHGGETRSAPVDLGLSLKSNGPELALTWNPKARAVREATTGVLRISDGPLRGATYLSRQQLQEGRTTYTPVHSDVALELELTGPRGTTGEQVRSVGMPEPQVSADAAEHGRVETATSRPSPARPAVKRARGREADDADDDEPAGEADRRADAAPAAAMKTASVSAQPSLVSAAIAVAPARTSPPVLKPMVSVEFEQAPESGFRKAFQRVPGLRLLGKLRFKGDKKFTAAKPLHVAKPSAAVNSGPDSRVRLEVYLDENGHVSGVEALEPRASDRLTGMATTAVYNSRFEPARLNGHPVDSRLIATFDFHPSGSARN